MACVAILSSGTLQQAVPSGCSAVRAYPTAQLPSPHPSADRCCPRIARRLQAGSAEDWGSGVALPETVLRRATVTLENLSHVSRGDQEVGASCLLPCLWAAQEQAVRHAPMRNLSTANQEPGSGQFAVQVTQVSLL